ncbi:hypothetical protein [Novosphingobium humi]|uniref:Uncharacterized protein n=1 Tax=Novosphingobium humi TaxID=2282397 RepID=A0ABY7U3F9_9SPHN|nr:hypothetical protein [Novosphingobium humi]WCT80028.1 hypothetical protein PQ457_18385 [Novosphingobium humi]
MDKAYFCLDPASHSALMRCAFSKTDIVGIHSATKVELKLGKPHNHNQVRLTVGNMPDRSLRLQNHVAAYAAPFDQKERASELVKALPVAFIESNYGFTKQGRWP